MLWTFNYKKGPAPMQGCVEAHDEASAYRVMVAWGALHNIKVFGSVMQMILADESILPKEEEPVAKWVESKGVIEPHGPATWVEDATSRVMDAIRK